MADNDEWFVVDHPIYQIPVEELGLTETAIRDIKKLGVTSVGDCVDHFVRRKQGSTPGSMTLGFMKAMAEEVEPALKKHGYWHYVEEAEDS